MSVSIESATAEQITRAAKIMASTGCTLVEALNAPSLTEQALREMITLAGEGALRLVAFIEAGEAALASGEAIKCDVMRAYHNLYTQTRGDESGHAVQLMQGLSSKAEVSTRNFIEHCATPEEVTLYRARMDAREAKIKAYKEKQAAGGGK